MGKMECPVCYRECQAIKMVCGHALCKECITDWYQKGCNKDCPMCRKPICFRGIAKLKYEWDEKNYEDKYTEVFNNCIEEICESGFDDGVEVLLPVILKDITKTFSVLKELGYEPDYIDYLLMEEGLYLSERALKVYWYDDPLSTPEPVWRPKHMTV